MPKIIPILPDSTFFVETITLDNKIYQFYFAWNTRDEAWYLSINDTSNNPIVSGIKLVVDYEILHDYSYLNLPQGYLIAVDTSLQGLPATKDDLGTRVLLMYFTPEEAANGII